jgi:hypothetical protein
MCSQQYQIHVTAVRGNEFAGNEEFVGAGQVYFVVGITCSQYYKSPDNKTSEHSGGEFVPGYFSQLGEHLLLHCPSACGITGRVLHHQGSNTAKACFLLHRSMANYWCMCAVTQWPSDNTSLWEGVKASACVYSAGQSVLLSCYGWTILLHPL